MLNQDRFCSYIFVSIVAVPLVLILAEPSRAQVVEHKLTASDGEELDLFGSAVSFSGDRALVGAYLDDDQGVISGSAYVYERQGDGSWLEVFKLTASDGTAMDWFGFSVSLLGDRALVGAHLNDDLGDNSGSAYVFEQQEDDSWLEVAKLTASDGDAGDSFGRSVSLTEDHALVGAHADDGDRGSAYLFERQGEGSWLEVAKLTATDGAAEDVFGYSVSLSEGTLSLVGSPGDDDLGSGSGSAYVYRRQGDGSWLEVAKLTASDGAADDFFGTSVSLSQETRALVGVWLGNDYIGSAYVLDKIVPTAVETAVESSQGYMLSAAYPNPFNPRALVPFEVPEVAHVRLTLVDIFGREVAILLNRQVAAGSHEAVLDGGHLASGVYLVRLEAEGIIHATQKVLLLR